MKYINCAQESAVTKALRAGNLDESLAAHAAACPVCRSIVQVSTSMQTLARGPENTRVLQDASLVWRKAQLSEQQARAEKAQAILEWVEIAFATAGSLGLAAWVAWNWFTIQEWLTGMLASAQLWLAAYSTSAAFLPIVVILCVTAVALAYPIVMDV